jgi:hypothetical protein
MMRPCEIPSCTASCWGSSRHGMSAVSSCPSREEGRVDVWTGHPRGARWSCPECDRELPTYDHAEERAWRHLDSSSS